jgi:surface polysaccharide O-acyltransferase-like enzyme
VVSAIVVASGTAGLAGSLLEYAGWAVAMHLWFLAVYLIVVSLTPIAIAAQHRWGLIVPTALACCLVAVDVAVLAGQVRYLSWLNYLLCWGLLYQIGIAWQIGHLAGIRPALLAAGSAGALWLLIWLGPYPISMIGVPGQAVQNTEPPSVAMLAFGGAQAGLAIAFAPALSSVLRGGAVQRVLSRANTNVMALYLWHMIPVVIVAVTAYPAGLLPQPDEGGAQWWLARLQWVAILSVVTAVELALLWWGRRFFAAPLPGVSVPRGRWAEPVMLVGTLMASYGFAFLAAEGFAPDGHFPWLTAAIFAVGVLLVALRSKSRVHVEAVALRQ